MENPFRTDDILIASFLLAQKARFLDLESNNSNHFYFIFDDSETCELLVREYLNDALAPAQKLFSKREELISAIRHRSENRNKYGKSNQ